jgi:hypothetical protein
MFPPPFRQDALSWINQIASLPNETAVFFWGWPDDDTSGAPVPIYGQILEIMKQRTLRRIADDNYISGDLNKLILSAETETRPQHEINRALALSRPPQGALAAIRPALAMGEAQLPAGDPNRASLTWETTRLLESDWAILPGAAQALASAFMAQLTGVELQWPTIKIRGDENMQWGDVVHVVQDGAHSDSTINLHNRYFRIERVDHNLSFDGALSFTTTIFPRPLTAFERESLSAILGE